MPHRQIPKKKTPNWKQQQQQPSLVPEQPHRETPWNCRMLENLTDVHHPLVSFYLATATTQTFAYARRADHINGTSIAPVRQRPIRLRPPAPKPSIRRSWGDGAGKSVTGMTATFSLTQTKRNIGDGHTRPQQSMVGEASPGSSQRSTEKETALEDMAKTLENFACLADRPAFRGTRTPTAQKQLGSSLVEWLPQCFFESIGEDGPRPRIHFG